MRRFTICAIVLLAIFATAVGQQLNCEEAVAQPGEVISVGEMAEVCHRIVKNRYAWNWQKYSRSLISGLPDYLRESWGQYFACNLKECPQFVAGSCNVKKQTSGDQFVSVSPCPAKYMCYACLPKHFDKPQAGAFDNLYQRI